MYYTIKACLESGCFDRVHMSTDSEEYAKIARECGADVPFLRSGELATDDATMEGVIHFVLEEYKKRQEIFQVFGIMQPTSPLRNKEDIQRSFALMKEKNADSIIGVCEMEHSPLWTNTLDEEGSMDGFLSQVTNQNRQLFQPYYRINGGMYLMKVEKYTNHMALYGSKSYAYKMPKERSIDIDDEMDFFIAQALIKQEVSLD